MRGQVGNGEKVEVWKDKWIPDGKLIPIDTSNCFTPLKVSALIEKSSTSWKIDHIQTFISASDVNAIKSIPLGDLSGEDKLIWPLVTTGSYSVKSGYYWQ